jgi:hypothetical protein
LALERFLELAPEPEVEPDVEPELGPEPEPETMALPGLPQLSRLPTSWHFFLSHMQTEATDLVHTLFHMMDKCGCRAWLDMQADKINLDAMRAGVRASDCLLLVLTKGVLFRPYCIAEVYEAIKAGKRIVLVSEDDPRGHLAAVRWDFERWRKHWDVSGVVEVEDEIAATRLELADASAAADWDRGAQLMVELKALSKQQVTKTSDYDWCRTELEADVFEKTPAGAQRAMDAVRDMVLANQHEVIPFRRRKFENEATLAEIFRRCQVRIRPV